MDGWSILVTVYSILRCPFPPPLPPLQVIFGELFQLPAPPHIDVMYTALLIELCKLQPGSLPQVVSFIVCAASTCSHMTKKSANDNAGLIMQLCC